MLLTRRRPSQPQPAPKPVPKPLSNIRGSQTPTRQVRYPKRNNAVKRVQLWTGQVHRDVCDIMGGRKMQNSKGIIQGLRAYMKHSSPRAPSVPRAFKVPDALYRGVSASSYSVPSVGDTVPAGKKGCFASFTRDRKIAEYFANRPQNSWDVSADSPIIFRLQLDRIARSTPWIWFDGKNSDPVRNRVKLPKGHGNEAEVLMPPGNLKILRKSKSGVFTIFDVAFAPHADYLRRGVLPKQQDNKLVFKTAGGNRLEIAAANAIAALQRRRSKKR